MDFITFCNCFFWIALSLMCMTITVVVVMDIPNKKKKELLSDEDVEWTRETRVWERVKRERDRTMWKQADWMHDWDLDRRNRYNRGEASDTIALVLTGDGGGRVVEIQTGQAEGVVRRDLDDY